MGCLRAAGRVLLAWTLTVAAERGLHAQGLPGPTSKPPAAPALGLANLVVRLEGADSIGLVPEQLRIHILEALRAANFNAVGAESLVFGKDHSERADLLLGGTIHELQCIQHRTESRCRIGVDWQLLDVHRDAVIYSVTTRFAYFGVDRIGKESASKALVLGALQSLTARSRFTALAKTAARNDRTPSTAPAYPTVAFRSCAARPATMPAAADDILGATVLVQSNDGFGSGFLLSADGLVMTAAHVVGGELKVRTRGGSEYRAGIVRAARNSDTALLRIIDSPPALPCLAVDLAPKRIGSEVYAIGSPASRELAFSLTRGIVSGLRPLGGAQFLQTDASISPGNSGGPLIDKEGRVVAIVSWKLFGRSVEGIAFGVPIEYALASIGLVAGARTDPALQRTIEAVPASDKPIADVDQPDGVPALDPEADMNQRWAAEEQERARRERAREAEEAERYQKRDAMTPGYVKALGWSGIAISTLGAIGIVATYASYSVSSTQPQYESLRLENDLSWIAVGAGASMFVVSRLLIPPLPPPAKSSGQSGPSVDVALAPSGGFLRVGSRW